MRSTHLIMMAVLACPLATLAAPQAKDATGANPTDAAPPPAAQGAIIDKTRPATGASGVAPTDKAAMEGAKDAATTASGPAPAGRKHRPSPVGKGASTAR